MRLAFHTERREREKKKIRGGELDDTNKEAAIQIKRTRRPPVDIGRSAWAAMEGANALLLLVNSLDNFPAKVKKVNS